MPRKPLFVHDYLLCKGVKDRYVWHSHSGASPPTPAHPVITAARKRILINELIITLVNNIVLFWNHSIAAQTHTESCFFLVPFPYLHTAQVAGCEFRLFLILPIKVTFLLEMMAGVMSIF